jgi:hypothetical protein
MNNKYLEFIEHIYQMPNDHEQEKINRQKLADMLRDLIDDEIRNALDNHNNTYEHHYDNRWD